MKEEIEVTQVLVSAELSDWIARRIAAFAVEASENQQGLAKSVAELGVLPLYSDWTATLGIRPDGELIRWSTDEEEEGTRPLDKRIWVLAALTTGAQRYAELQCLVPTRGAHDVDCSCQNPATRLPSNVLCGDCGGLGWKPGPGGTPIRREFS